MKLRRAAVVVALLALASPGPAHGAGYSIYEQGAAVLGRGGAATASVEDPSALFFNPARLPWLGDSWLQAGTTALTPTTSFAGIAPDPGYGVSEAMRRQTFFPSTVYLTHRYDSGWAAGAGVNTPFGLGVEWQDPDRFTGRAIVTKADLRTVNATFCVARALSAQWSLGAGADLLFANVALRNRTLAPVPGGGGEPVDVAETRLTSDRTPGWGWNAGAAWVPNAQWRLGASYRGAVVVHVDDGRAEFRQIPTGDAAFDAAVAAQLPPDQRVATVLRFPASAAAGLAWLPEQSWTLEADAVWFQWSVFRDLPLRFDQTPSANRTLVEDYDDAWQFRVGAEHRLPRFTYRFGYYFDQAAAPDASLTPLLPDADRHGVTLGLGLGAGRWTLDAYELALFVPRRSTHGVERDGYDGTYRTYVNAAGADVSFHW